MQEFAVDVVPGQDVRHLLCGRNLDEQHRTILDDFVGEVLPDVDVLGSFTSADGCFPIRCTRCCPHISGWASSA